MYDPDDIPVRGFIGDLQKSATLLPQNSDIYLSTHLLFNVEYNKDQVLTLFSLVCFPFF